VTADRFLPDGWRWARFGDVVRQVKDRVDPDASGLERYVAGEHMDSDDLRIRRWGRIGDGYLGPAFHMRFRPGQVLYGSRRTYLRKVALADFEGVCANTTFVVESGRPDLLPDFLPFVMSVEAFHAHSIQQSKGSVNPYINFSDLAWYEFALPPIDHQRAIVELLTASRTVLEEYYRTAQQLTDLIDRLITTRFQQLAAAGSPTPLPELADITMGRQKAPKYETGASPVRYVRVANIGHLEMSLGQLETMDFSDEEVRRYRLEPGDVLLTEGDIVSPMNVGRSAVFPADGPECCFQNTLIRLRPRGGVRPMFLMAMVEGARLSGLLAATASTTTVTHLGLGRLSRVALPWADETVQRRVVEELSAILSLRVTLREVRSQASRADRSLRNRLLDGTPDV
jgi:type I restriction enzyme S subunit